MKTYAYRAPYKSRTARMLFAILGMLGMVAVGPLILLFYVTKGLLQFLLSWFWLNWRIVHDNWYE